MRADIAIQSPVAIQKTGEAVKEWVKDALKLCPGRIKAQATIFSEMREREPFAEHLVVIDQYPLENVSISADAVNEKVEELNDGELSVLLDAECQALLLGYIRFRAILGAAYLSSRPDVATCRMYACKVWRSPGQVTARKARDVSLPLGGCFWEIFPLHTMMCDIWAIPPGTGWSK